MKQYNNKIPMFVSQNRDPDFSPCENVGTKQNGFSILEIITVIFIIAMGLVGVLSLIVQNIQIQYVNKNNLIASQLAQEGLELVRNKRDYNWKENYHWKDGDDLDSNTDIVQDKTYVIDYEGDIIDDIDSIDDEGAVLKIDANGFYSHGAGSVSNFRRLITIVESLDSDYLEVSCRIKWQERNNNYSYVADTELWDWR